MVCAGLVSIMRGGETMVGSLKPGRTTGTLRGS
jgi:hypothetical protein